MKKEVKDMKWLFEQIVNDFSEKDLSRGFSIEFGYKSAWLTLEGNSSGKGYDLFD